MATLLILINKDLMKRDSLYLNQSRINLIVQLMKMEAKEAKVSVEAEMID